MKRGKIVLIGILIIMIMLIIVSADDFNVGVEVSNGELGSEKGFFYNMVVNPFLKFFQALGLSREIGECGSGYGDYCPPGTECEFLVGCIEGVCQYNYVEAGTLCVMEDGIEGLCDEAGSCALPEVVETPFGGICIDDCVSKYNCDGNKVVFEIASCDLEKGGCNYETEIEECGLCETCTKVDISKYLDDIKKLEEISTEKPDLSDISKVMWAIREVSKPVTGIVAEIVLGDVGDVMLGIGGLGIIDVLFGQIGILPPPDKIKGVGEFHIEIPFWISSWLDSWGRTERIPSIIAHCMSDEQCEHEKRICPEYSNNKLVDSKCNPQKNPEKYGCTYKGPGMCKTKNFIIEGFPGWSEQDALRHCCSWARRLEHEKCKQEADLYVREIGKTVFLGGNYDGKVLPTRVTFNFWNVEKPTSLTRYVGNLFGENYYEMVYTGTPDQVEHDLIAGEIAYTINRNAFNKEVPPWLYKGLSYTFMRPGKDGQKCKYFKELANIKNQITLDKLKKVLGKENPGAIDHTDSLIGAAFIEFLMSRGPRFAEKNMYYAEFFWEFIFYGYEYKTKGYRTWHTWEWAMKAPPPRKRGEPWTMEDIEQGSYNIQSIEQAHAEFIEWLNNKIGPNGEVEYGPGMLESDKTWVNPCTCVTREEYEKQLAESG